MSNIFLIPSVLDESAFHTIPAYIVESIQSCQAIFAENERTARRFLKKLCKEIVIDSFEWFPIHKAEEAQIIAFKEKIREGKHIAIISEAGCPGIADPGQLLIAVAHEMGAMVKPLVGPSSILLALMASGMNGQQFEFVGYLPIDPTDRIKKLKDLELSSQKNSSTKIFIETPYRNSVLLETILKSCKPTTRLCIACELTSPAELIINKSIEDWKKEKIDIHKKPAIFLLLSK